MKKAPLALATALMALVIGTASFQLAANPSPASDATAALTREKPQQHILINLKHYTDDLHAVYMALKIVNGLQERGANVTLFLNLEGVRLADKNTPDDLLWGHTKTTPGELLSRFVASGGTVLVCPHCANAAGLSPEDVRANARIVEDAEVMDAFMAATKVIDY